MNDTGLDHPEQNINIEKHHYFQNLPVAKLFASKDDHNNERGTENDPMYKAINQSLNALVYYRQEHSIIPETRHSKVVKVIYYPIIIFNSLNDFYQTSINESGNNTTPITDTFQLEINYAYISKEHINQNEYFLIDVVDFNKFEVFLDNLENTDIKTIKEDIAWKHRNINKNDIE